MPGEVAGVAPTVLGVAPWVIITAVVTWFGSLVAFRQKAKESEDAHTHKVEVHRDDLTLQIIRTGREELALAKREADDLRDELRSLRAMENHFYHFHQSLDHLEALLTAETAEEREIAERNAKAFLKRMRRLDEARGTFANEAQRITSGLAILEREEEGK